MIMKNGKKTTSRILSVLLSGAMLFSTLPMFGPASSGDETSDTENKSGVTDKISQLVSDGEKLPEMYITTDSGKLVTKKVYEGASMRIALPDRFAEFENDYTTENGAKIVMKARGNSTFTMNDVKDSGKYSYKIKLDKKADLLGMGRSKHWVLISNIYDVTNMRNKLTYDFSGMLGMPYCESRWVVLYVNGEYRGLYSLVESLRIDEGRLDITNWEERAENVSEAIGRKEGLDEVKTKQLGVKMRNDLRWVTTGKFDNYTISDYYDTSSFNIDSGYFIEYDGRMDGNTTKFYTSHGKPIQIDNPASLKSNPQMLSYVQELLDDFEEAIYSPTFCTSDGTHYSEFVDVDSMIDYYLIFELFKNIEFGWLSIYLYIENGIIYFGPCWDFDNASGNQVTLTDDWMHYDRWINISGRAEWWKKLSEDPAFIAKFENRWFEIRGLVDEMLESMDIYYRYIYDEAVRNWELMGPPHNWYIGNSKCKSFEDEYKVMHDWMYNRVKWLDEQLSTRTPNIESHSPNTSDRLSLSLVSDKGRLVKESKAAGGVTADYQYDIDKNGNLVLRIVTKHTSHRNALIYVNGKFIEKVAATDDKLTTVTINRDALDLTEGAISTIYVQMLNHEDNYYKCAYLYVRAMKNVLSGPSIVNLKIGDQPMQTIESGSVITLPEITDSYRGYNAVGWTDGKNVYAQGSEITVKSHTYLYPKWERTYLFPDRAETVPDPVVPDNPDTPEPPDPNDNKKNNILLFSVIGTVSVLIVGGGIAVVLLLKKRKRQTEHKKAE